MQKPFLAWAVPYEAGAQRPDQGLPPGYGGHPSQGLPGYGHPDQGLPGFPNYPSQGLPGYGHPDQGLPGYGHPGNRPPGSWGGRPDQGLPGYGHPDQGLPGGGHASGQPILPTVPQPPVVISGPGIDNELPGGGQGGQPSHPWVPPQLGGPAHPIVIPPEAVGPGLPSQPIYLPPYLPKGSTLLIPLEGGGERPDQGLPGGRPDRPDQGLPGSGARPDQGLPGQPPHASGQPVPGGGQPPTGGQPLPPTAQPKAALPQGVPPGSKPYIAWQGPGTMPKLVFVSPQQAQPK